MSEHRLELLAIAGAILLCILGAILLFTAGCRSGRDPAGSGAPPEDEVWLTRESMESSKVAVAEVSEQDIPQAVTAAGKVAFDDLHVTHVFSPVTGRVSRVIAQPGQRVKKGSPLVAILSPDVGSAFSDVIKAQADLVAAEHDLHRQQQLFDLQAAPRRDLETAEDNFQKAKAEHDRARQKAALLRTGSLDDVTQEYTLRSYIEGEVIARNVNPGMEVQGQYSGGTPVELFTIGDIQRVWVYTELTEADLPRVKLGADVSVKVLAYPDRIFRGRVDWISSTLDPVLRTTRIRCALENREEALKPEMFATVSIATPPRRALALAREALVHIGDQTFAFVASGTRPDGRMVFKRRHVRVEEEAAGDLVPVREGLSSGERVVVEGSVSRETPNDQAWLTRKQIESAGIEVAPARERDVEDAISIGGRLAFHDLLVTHIFSPVTGRVTRVLAQLGQRVEKGTPLVAIASPDVGSAFSDLVKAQADLVAAEHEYQRQKELYEAHAGSQKDLETAEDAWRKARAEFERAQKKTRLLGSGTVDKVTQEYTLRSPIAGRVIARNVNPGMELQGQYSGASNAVELFTIGETDKLWVLGDVYEIDLPFVREGAPVSIKVAAYPDKIFEGKVEWVSDVLDAQLRTAKVRCAIANPEQLLKPEMYERVTISVPARQTVAVPREAVLRLGNETAVFVEAGKTPDGKVVFKRRRVIANEEKTSGLVAISDGVKPGERVVINGAIFLAGML